MTRSLFKVAFMVLLLAIGIATCIYFAKAYQHEQAISSLHHQINILIAKIEARKEREQAAIQRSPLHVH